MDKAVARAILIDNAFAVVAHKLGAEAAHNKFKPEESYAADCLARAALSYAAAEGVVDPQVAELKEKLARAIEQRDSYFAKLNVALASESELRETLVKIRAVLGS